MIRSKAFGPFSYYWGPDKRFLNVYLTRMSDYGCGWQWGHDNYAPECLVCVQILGLDIFLLDLFKWGFDIRVLGFWWIFAL